MSVRLLSTFPPVCCFLHPSCVACKGSRSTHTQMQRNRTESGVEWGDNHLPHPVVRETLSIELKYLLAPQLPKPFSDCIKFFFCIFTHIFWLNLHHSHNHKLSLECFYFIFWGSYFGQALSPRSFFPRISIRNSITQANRKYSWNVIDLITAREMVKVINCLSRKFIDLGEPVVESRLTLKAWKFLLLWNTKIPLTFDCRSNHPIETRQIEREPRFCLSYLISQLYSFASFYCAIDDKVDVNMTRYDEALRADSWRLISWRPRQNRNDWPKYFSRVCLFCFHVF